MTKKRPKVYFETKKDEKRPQKVKKKKRKKTNLNKDFFQTKKGYKERRKCERKSIKNDTDIIHQMKDFVDL